MKPLSSQNIESELSYAYLHAVASAAGVSCSGGTRHEDNAGVDAKLVGWGPFPGGGYRTEVDIKVQLKATVQQPTIVGDCFSYYFPGISQYNDLRSAAVSTPRILVVLFLPENPVEWMSHTEDALLLRRCAYWVSLRGAPVSSNETGQTVYIPKNQKFDADGLRGLMAAISNGAVPLYKGKSNE
jgi:Domain of unknown function (DUF4365)